MSTLETMKHKSQENLNHLVDLAKTPPSEAKIWGVTAGAAVAGGIAMTVGAPGLLAIFATLASPPIALAVGVIGGGVLGWRYMERQKAVGKASVAADAVASAPAPVDAGVSKSTILSQVSEPLLITPESATENQSAEPAAAEPIHIVVATPPTQQDRLEDIVGVGPVFVTRLHAAGIYTFAQLAASSPEQLLEIMAPSRGGHMIDAPDWIEQARQLAASANREES